MVITLVGYRGTGKSTVGAQLASRLNWDFVDIDREIEHNSGKSISAIFAESGEPFFRLLESAEIARQLARDSVVVSAGGGAILEATTRQHMAIAGPVVWLQADVPTIIERLRSDQNTLNSRPSLTGQDICDEIATVLLQREPLYSDAASLIIQTDHHSIAAIVDEIISQLPELGAGR